MEKLFTVDPNTHNVEKLIHKYQGDVKQNKKTETEFGEKLHKLYF